MSSEFERVGGEEVFEGKIFSVWRETFRHADGVDVTRESARHSGAVGVVAVDEESVWLVRQPRETVGVGDLLEIPAGRLDHEGEDPLDTAERELAEEIGKAATEWELMHEFFTSPGFTDERFFLYLASGLSDRQAESGEHERIDVVRWPLDRLHEAVATCHDAKSLIGLLLLQQRRSGRR
jgi:8-oxo-dGTP pyrophosphatase MutT (NUDIX family)